MGWVKAVFAPVGALVAALVAFYFTTTATLNEHSRQFIEVKEQFNKFNNTLVKNYEDYAKNQKEEAAVRERQRERFETLFKDFGMNTAAMKVQVDGIVKSLDEVKANQQRARDDSRKR